MERSNKGLGGGIDLVEKTSSRIRNPWDRYAWNRAVGRRLVVVLIVGILSSILGTTVAYALHFSRVHFVHCRFWNDK